jgi:hypothetical protein
MFFVEKGEIKEPDILEYYRKRVSDVEKNIGFISKQYIDVNGYEETQEILSLIRKYYELTIKIKIDKESS